MDNKNLLDENFLEGSSLSQLFCVLWAKAHQSRWNSALRYSAIRPNYREPQHLFKLARRLMNTSCQLGLLGTALPFPIYFKVYRITKEWFIGLAVLLQS